MEYIKNYGKFVKENSDVLLHNPVDNNDSLTNSIEEIKKIPSEMWTEDMERMVSQYESKENDDLYHTYNVEDEEIDGVDSDILLHHDEEQNELSEKFSELEPYEIKDIFNDEEEEEIE
ncbi:MAG: hypothetical protein KC550_07595 [Nanoarchaeota archaeon]|nr:hypothetical protein [Nanoarchaeota archaeon]